MKGRASRSAAQRGLSLMEVLIAMVIVAILATIAYPSYRSQVQAARRADAQQALLALAAALERYHTLNLTYAGAAEGDADTGPPAIFATEAPLDGDRKYYDLRITAADVDVYTVQAQPKNDQDGDGVLQVSADGSRGWDRDDDGSIGTDERCWKKSC